MKELKALSIRQPWAWLILNGGKDVENRSWSTNHRGPFLIHAPKTMTVADYDEARVLAKKHRIELPAKKDLQRGGIVGKATLADCVEKSRSTWHYKASKHAFVLTNVKKAKFRECNGRLGFFVPEYL